MFIEKGWQIFNYQQSVADWAKAAYLEAIKLIANPLLQEKWLQCEGTWFVGVDTIPSDEVGSIGGIPLAGKVIDKLSFYETRSMHPAQLSVVFPGYPRARKGETTSAYSYRLKRDGAHVDGLLPVGRLRQRMLKEPHAYILGIPLNEFSAKASPLAIWEGSHIVMSRSFRKVLNDINPSKWHKIDLTQVYKAARRQIFEDCKRIELTARPGEAYILHRLTLHGISPWKETSLFGKEGRMIAYFRPELEDISQWIEL